jgi:secernin
MCDTFVALGNSTVDGSVILGKNSDREPNEAHEILVFPAADHQPGSMVDCTYIQIPQVSRTHALMLAKPFWIWGAEMGVNEHGLAIGNEAIFTKVPYDKENGLIGMDFIRLALERAKTAFEGLKVITGLLEQYGQSGSCGFSHPFYYHNSYILADPQEAWVLETVGRQWVAEKVRTVRSISNGATIGSTWDLASQDLVRYAADRGWCKNRDDFHFARCYSDRLYTTLSDSRSRASCTLGLLSADQGKISVQTAVDILRSHGSKPSSQIRLDRSLIGAQVCMHSGAGPVRESQTTGSLVAHLAPDQITSWVTATAAPCISLFKPVWIDAGYPLAETSPQGTYSPDHLWWRHEQLHREVIRDYAARAALFEDERSALQANFIQSAAQCGNTVEDRRAFSAACFQKADEAAQKWLDQVRSAPITRPASFYYTRAWNTFKKKANMV